MPQFPDVKGKKKEKKKKSAFNITVLRYVNIEIHMVQSGKVLVSNNTGKKKHGIKNRQTSLVLIHKWQISGYMLSINQ